MAGLTTRRATNLSMPAALVEEARALGINLSEASENGVRAAIAAARGARWQADHAATIKAANAWVETNGLPLEKHRQF